MIKCVNATLFCSCQPRSQGKHINRIIIQEVLDAYSRCLYLRQRCKLYQSKGGLSIKNYFRLFFLRLLFCFSGGAGHRFLWMSVGGTWFLKVAASIFTMFVFMNEFFCNFCRLKHEDHTTRTAKIN